MVEKGNKLVCADEQWGYVTSLKKEQDHAKITLMFSELYDNIDLLTKFFAFVYTT